MRLVIDSHDQTIEFAPLLLIVEEGQCAPEVSPRVRLRTHNAVPQRETAARRKLNACVGEGRDSEIFGLLAEQDGESSRASMRVISPFFESR